MRTPASRRLAVLTSALLAIGVAGSPAGAEPVAAAPSQPAGAQASTTQPGPGRLEPVTLITGDRVGYTSGPDGRESVTLEPAPRPDGLAPYFNSFSDPSGYYVIPSDAQPLIASGAVDRELFDVRELVRTGLGDRSGQGLPVIATYHGRPSAGALSRDASALPGSTRAVPLPALGGVALRVDRGRTAEFWRAARDQQADANARSGQGLRKLWLDAPVRATLDQSVPQVGAPSAWRAGFDGTGVTVAVLDTGVDANHPDLAGKVIASQNFTADPSVVDGHGHGTHVAATIAGTGAASGGSRKGVAPGASLLAGKVLNNAGSGYFSQIIAGMEWAIQSGARVINMSLGGGFSDGTDVLSQAVNAYAAQHGVLFVIAAGNSGPASATVTSPGAADAALTVGAVDKQDQIAWFSSRGPRRGDGAIKPEITAPGHEIVAARAAGTDLGQPEGPHYTSLSGTSMATPHVAGAAAILAQANPAWRAPELKSALVGSAKPIEGSAFVQGAGRLDVARASSQPVTTDVSVVNFGRFAWPQSDTAPVSRTVTYRNRGTTPVTLRLSVSAHTLRGQPSPSGALQVSTTELTVPATGTAVATVTLDPRIGGTGSYGGSLVATSADGAVTVRTPLSYHNAVRTHRLTLNLKNSNGEPGRGSFQAVRLDHLGEVADPSADLIFDIYPSGGRAVVDLPAGVYDIAGEITEYGLTSYRTTTALESEVDLTNADRELTFDARQAVSLRPPTEERTDPFSISVGSVWKLPEQRIYYLRAFLWSHHPDADVRAIPSRKAPSPGRYTFTNQWTLAAPMVTMRPTGGRGHGRGEPVHPVYYWVPHVVERLDGRFTAPLVPVGAGNAEDFAGRNVAGKLALVTLRPPDRDPIGYLLTQSATAIRNGKAAGVKALLLHVDAPNSVIFQPYPVGGISLPVLSLRYEEGRRLQELLARGPVELAVEAKAHLDTTYHLNYDHPKGIPAASPGLARRSELARVPMRLHADGPDHDFGVAFFAHTDLPTNGKTTTFLASPAEHTAYLGPATDRYVWHRAGYLYDAQDRWVHAMESHGRFPKPGRYEEDHWFAGPLVPGAYEPAPDLRGRTFELFCGYCREGDVFLPTGFDFDSERGHWTYTDSWRHQVRMFAGDRELPLQPLSEDYFGIGYYRLPPEPATYRLQDVFADPRGDGRTVRTTWTFHSAGRTAPRTVPDGSMCVLDRLSPDASCRHEPLINLRYDFDVDLDNTVRGHRAHVFEVQARHHSQAGGGRIAGLTVAVSQDDGATWRPVHVSGKDGRYRAVAKHPRAGHMSIKVIAWDTAGNRVEQEVIRAYELR